MNTVKSYVKAPNGQVFCLQTNDVPEVVTRIGAMKLKWHHASLTDDMQARMRNLSQASANHGFW